MSGLHHVTAIAGNALRNLDFYTRTLGLRLVKRTVNFDDPGTYHLYYGDESGRPGTVLTFFPWEHAVKGRVGVGETQQTAFRVPARALGFWTQRLIEKGVAHEAPEKRFGETVLPFSDPDGMSLALVGVPGAETEPGWSNGEIPAEHAIRGFYGVRLLLDDAAKTGAILTDVLGLGEAGREGALIRYRAAGGGPGAVVDIEQSEGLQPGRQGRGSVHHIAFRAAADVEQAAMARKLVTQHGVHPTDQRDRNYFRSIYFREPGGVLFEIATDIPGFAVDEPLASLGSALKLPPFLEPRRGEIEKALPALEEGAKPKVDHGMIDHHGRGTVMTKVTYEVVEHDGGWAYRADGVYSETFPTHDLARRAAERAAQEQLVAGATTGISYEDQQGRWHDEVARGDDRPETEVKG